MKGLLFIVSAVTLMCGSVLCKECTNIPTGATSGALPNNLGSANQSWEEDLFAHYHLTPSDDSVWSTMRPKDVPKENELDWDMTYRKMKYPGQFRKPGEFLKELSLHDVRLEPDSLHWKAQQTNLEYLLMLDVDRLAWNFRKTAGLPTPNVPYGGWESPDQELRGHFVGHYMSATAQMWAATHNETLRQKMSSLVSALSACQEQMGTGYLSAFPSVLFDQHETFQKYVWAPYYTIHKILAGLLDQYTFANNTQALKMATSMVDYFFNRVKNVITKYTLAGHYLTLNNESGGMNDVLYRLYNITGDQKHVILAHLFDKPCFLGGLAIRHDDLAGFHANTHIPLVIGSQRRYEVLGDPIHREIATFFSEIINSSHSFATGGTSEGEFWTAPNRLASFLTPNNEESCTTYNMLKISRNLFRWTKGMAYADHYERALTNGVLSTQRGTEPGVMIYFLPLGPGNTKAISGHGWGTPFDSFWCCYGTGIESFSKLGDSIYFEEEGEVPGLYVIQYISSTLNWRTGDFVLSQKVDPVVSWDPNLRVTLTFASQDAGQSSTARKGTTGKSATLHLRIPYWTRLDGAKAAINDQVLQLSAPGSFLSITRKWNPGDRLTLQFPINMRTEAIKDYRPEYASLQAILFGPYLLAGHSTGDMDIKSDSSSDWITPIPAAYNNHLASFFQLSGNSTFYLMNLNQSIIMGNSVQPGNNTALQATFRLILANQSSTNFSTYADAIGKSIMIEPFDYPGMLVADQGANNSLVIASQSSSSSVFNLVQGLDGKQGTVSLESTTNQGCFVSAGFSSSSASGNVKLSCNLDMSNAGVRQDASFVISKGLIEYHPISFVTKGVKRNFLMQPLLNYRNETYTVYFNIQA